MITRVWLLAFACAWLSAVCTMGSAGTAHADAAADTEAQALAALASPHEEEVRLAIETLGLVPPSTRTATALVERVRRGLPGGLLDGAITTLAAMHNPVAVPLLLELAHDRRPAIRARAYEALGTIGGAAAITALRAGVDDDVPEVRIAAVGGLNATDDRASVALLLRAFDRGVVESAQVIGRLGDADQVRALLGHVGNAPLDAVLAGAGEALQRADLPQRLRLDIVARLTELATENIRAFFVEVMPMLPGGANDPVRRALNDAIVRISG